MELNIQVYENERIVYAVTHAFAVELGRQSLGENGPYWLRQIGDRWRMVIARLDEQLVPRRFALAEPLPTGQVRITNLSRSPIRFLGGGQLEPNHPKDLSLPIVLVVGNRKIGFESSGSERAANVQLLEEEHSAPLQTLAEATAPPGSVRRSDRPHQERPNNDFQNEKMIRWLQSAMDVFQSAASSTEFFDKAANALVEMIGLDCGQVLLFRNGDWILQSRTTSDNRPGQERKASGRILSRLLAEKRTFWQAPTTETRQGSMMGINVVVAAPILDQNGTVLGALYGDCNSTNLRADLTRLDAQLVELLANLVAAGLGRIEQNQAEMHRQKKLLVYEREMQIGQNIQNGFLPEALPQLAGWEIAAHFQPAREVAGDFYDCFSLSADHVVLVMADVCDKGVGAALFMALFRTLIRAFCIQTGLKMFIGISDHDPKNQSNIAVLPANRGRATLLGDLIALLAIEHTNKYVTSQHANALMFATMFLAVLDTTSGELSYINAGHDSPTIIGPSGAKERLKPTGPAVGIMPDAAFTLGKTRLDRGDILLAHTDGVTDARDVDGTSYSEKRFLGTLVEGASSASLLVERILLDLRSHIGNADQFDDISLLAVRWLP